jgi:hypothetical protein
MIGMWAIVLVPMWLRRHDRSQESKSADRFARAMGTLRRGDAGAAARQREVLMPGRPTSVRRAEVTVTGPLEAQTPAAQAAARRRRVLAVLAGLLVVWTVVVVLHRVPTWTLAVPALVVVGFLVVARRQVSLAADIRRRQERRATLAEAARAAEARSGAVDGHARRGGRSVETSARVEREAPTRSEVPVEHVMVDKRSWNAVPTTLPTYVTAPRATSVPRVIDLTTPGSWSGAAMMEQARESLAPEPLVEGEMRAETFAITVPRDPAVRAGVFVEPATYADRFVADDVDVEALADSDDIDYLLEDPRTGVHGPTWRRAANG